jgi:hypothetical protein
MEQWGDLGRNWLTTADVMSFCDLLVFTFSLVRQVDSVCVGPPDIALYIAQLLAMHPTKIVFLVWVPPTILAIYRTSTPSHIIVTMSIPIARGQNIQDSAQARI